MPSATRHPIHFMFGSRVWFSGTADQMALLPVGSNSRWRLAAILKISDGHVFATGHPIEFIYLRSLYFGLGHNTSLLTLLRDWGHFTRDGS